MEMDYPKTRMDNFFAKAAGSELADDSMEPITDREYWVNEMAEKINSGGSGLPEITEVDEGKVLTVDEGAAVWAEGGGGSATIVECVYDDATHTITSSLTAKELWDAYAAGGAIVSYTDEGYTIYEIILLAAKGGGNPGYNFRIGDGGFSADAGTDYPVATLE